MNHQIKTRQAVDIKFKNISYFAPSAEGKKQILNAISGEFKHSELNAIMGPSGAGKMRIK